MMKKHETILGIDYGLSKVGLAIGAGLLAEPLMIIRYKDIKILGDEIKKIVEKEKIDKIVVGISEGEMAEKTHEFILILRKNLSTGKTDLSIPIEEFDETLSTYDAQRLSMESGMRRSKRKNMEDACLPG